MGYRIIGKRRDAAAGAWELGALWLWLVSLRRSRELELLFLLSDACRDAAECRGVRVACVSRGAMFLEDPRLTMMMMMNNASPED